jgi:hypothetical protein
VKNPAVIIPRVGPVPDGSWAGAARHYDERGFAALIPMIATVNVRNRPDIATPPVARAQG